MPFQLQTAFSQSLMVTDGMFKLDYIGVLFIDPAVKIDETCLTSFFAIVAVCYTSRLWQFIFQLQSGLGYKRRKCLFHKVV